MKQPKPSKCARKSNHTSRACLIALVCCASAAAQGDVIFIDAFESDAAPVPNCDGVSPANFVQIMQTEVFNTNGNRLGIRDVSTLRGLYGGPVASDRLYFRAAGGQYFAFAFTGQQLDDDFPKGAYNPGGQPQTGGFANAGFAYITVSRCAGDFRLPADVPADDPWRSSPGCASNMDLGLTGDMLGFIVAGSVPSGSSVCFVDRTSTYYLNLVFADPRDGLQDGEIDCQSPFLQCGTKFDIE